MFCKNCGKEIQDDSLFCPECGAKIGEAPEQVEKVQSQPVSDKPVVTEEVEKVVAKKPKKTGKVIAIITVAIVLVAAIIVGVFAFVPGINIFGKGYEKEVENYLEFFAEKKKDPEEFMSSAYMGGQFGTYLNGKEADEINELIIETAFEEMSEMYYYGEDSDTSSWKKYLKNTINMFYNTIEGKLGDDWELDYKIKESKKMSKSDIEDLEDYLEDFEEYYEEMLDEVDFKSKDENKIEDFIEKISKAKIKEAYEVEVDIELEGDEESFEETYEFVVAKIGKDWVILKGPAIFDIIYAE
jgi:hypothetical protein